MFFGHKLFLSFLTLLYSLILPYSVIPSTLRMNRPDPQDGSKVCLLSLPYA